MLQPVLVRPVAGGTYELVAGERRWRAAQIAGLETIPALVRERDDAEALEAALIENMAREDLNPVEEARACARARRGARAHARGRSGCASVAAASRSRTSCACSTCPTRRSTLLERGELSEGHGRALLLASDHADRRRLARDGGRRGLVGARRSRRAPARPTTARRRRPRRARAPTELHPDQEAAATQIADALGGALGVEVTVTPRGTRLPRRARLRRPDEALAARAPPARLAPWPERPLRLRTDPFGRLAQSVRALL